MTPNPKGQVELRECPFCGGMVILKQWPQLNKLYLGDESKSTWSIFCSECLFEGIRHNKQVVIDAWNLRHKEK